MANVGPSRSFQLRALVSISNDLYSRLSALRRQVEARFGVRLDEDKLMDYLCERAIEKLEECVGNTAEQGGQGVS